MLSSIGIAFFLSAVNPVAQVEGCLTPTFEQVTGSPYAGGDAPIDVAVADFDRDGAPDVAIVGESSDNVTIRWGNGSGWFPTSSTFAAGDSPRAVAVADFNLDGASDLAIVNALSSNVTIRLNDGSGAFPDASMSTVGAGTTPLYIVAADFNLDGASDLAIVNAGSHNVTIRLGDGTGSFAAVSATVAVGSIPRGLAVGDFNYDGNPDFVTANTGSNNVTTCFGDGTGAFPTSTTTVSGLSPKEIKAADFNGDGKLDVAVACQLSNEVWILYGQTNGVFGFAVPHPAGATQPSLETGDFNADGNADIAVCDVSSNTVSVWLGAGTFGDGNLEFPPANRASFGTGSFPFAVAAGDFNLDGRADLVVGNFNSDSVTVLMNKCGSTPCDGAILSSTPGSPFAGLAGMSGVVFGDFAPDGHVDLAMTNSGSTSVTVRYGNGTGTFTPANHFSAGDSFSIATADLNLDGDLDLAVTLVGGGRVRLLHNNGLGLFSTSSTISVPIGSFPDRGSDVAIADFDRDGDPDLAFTDTTSSSVIIRLGDGTGAFPDALSSTLPIIGLPGELAVADFDRDGALDLLIGDAGGNSFVKIRFGDGQGGFPSADAKTIAMGAGYEYVVVGDFNRDGNPDFAAAAEFADRVTTRLGDGQGNFPDAGSITTLTGDRPVSLAVGDVNVDGKLDLAIAHYTIPIVMVRLGDGTGAFPMLATTALLPTSNLPGIVEIEDINLDGKPDVAGIDLAVGAMIFLNACPPNAPPVAVAGPTQTVQCAGATTQVTLNGSGSSDAEDGALEYSWSEGGTEIATGASPTVPLASGSHVITLTVTDPAGHWSSADVTIQVVDTVSPVITMAGSGTMTVECHSSFVDPGATANDVCAGPVPISTSSNVNVNTPGMYTIQYTATDGATTSIALRTVHVVDTLGPVITLAGSASMTVECHTSFVDPGATANDLCAGPVSVSATGSVDVNTPGIYMLTYTATAGTQTTSTTRTVTVSDTTAPVIMPSADVISLSPANHLYASFSVRGLATFASDGCDSTVNSADVVIFSVWSDEPEDLDGDADGNTLKDIVIAKNCKSVRLRMERDDGGDGRVYTVNMTVRDAAGNVGTATRQVFVPLQPGGTAIDDGWDAYVVNGCSP